MSDKTIHLLCQLNDIIENLIDNIEDIENINIYDNTLDNYLYDIHDYLLPILDKGVDFK